MVSHLYETIFIHIPKCAGTSVIEEFKKHDPSVDHGHIRISSYWGDQYANYYKFSFCRHPVDRMLSAYNYARLDESHWHKSKKGVNPHPAYKHLQDLSFEEHVEEIHKERDKLLRNHWVGCYQWHWDLQKNYVNDSVETFKIEEFQADMLPEKIKFVGAFGKMNESPNEKTDNIDSEVIEKIFDIYEPDYQYFNY